MNKLFSDEIKRVVNKPGVYYLKMKEQNYVGSSIDLKKRLMEHRQKLRKKNADNPRMQNIFSKYGEDCAYFSILEVLETDNLTEIREIEKRWIDLLGPTLNCELDPTTENNCTSTSKKVYQYTLDGKYVNNYLSTNEAGRKTGICSNTISACARGKIFSASGYYWSYKEISNYTYSVERSKWKWKAVEMTDLSTGIKLLFPNIAECVRSIYTPDMNFDSMCASVSTVASGKGKTLWKKYTFSYVG